MKTYKFSRIEFTDEYHCDFKELYSWYETEEQILRTIKVLKLAECDIHGEIEPVQIGDKIVAEIYVSTKESDSPGLMELFGFDSSEEPEEPEEPAYYHIKEIVIKGLNDRPEIEDSVYPIRNANKKQKWKA